MPGSLPAMLERACNAALPAIGQGQVARYIPALARVSRYKFGAAIATVEGERVAYGDASEPFSVQSISKVFTLTKALAEVGDELWQRVGREPSGDPFNSIVQLEREEGIPRNPFINAGAIVVCDVLLRQRAGRKTIDGIVEFLQEMAGQPGVAVDEEVAESEKGTGYRNASLANFLKAFGNLRHDVEQVLEVYFRQCAIAMSCTELARSALFLANDGVDPVTGQALVSPSLARRIRAMMLMCGHYDASGDFAYRVGLPGKSGVGGGIVVIVPSRAVIAVWSPCLNESGNSYGGTVALEHIVRETGWSSF